MTNNQTSVFETIFFFENRFRLQCFVSNTSLSLHSFSFFLFLICLVKKRALSKSHVAKRSTGILMVTIPFGLSDRDKDTSVSIKWNKCCVANISSMDNRKNKQHIDNMTHNVTCSPNFLRWLKFQMLMRMVSTQTASENESRDRKESENDVYRIRKKLICKPNQTVSLCSMHVYVLKRVRWYCWYRSVVYIFFRLNRLK